MARVGVAPRARGEARGEGGRLGLWVDVLCGVAEDRSVSGRGWRRKGERGREERRGEGAREGAIEGERGREEETQRGGERGAGAEQRGWFSPGGFSAGVAIDGELEPAVVGRTAVVVVTDSVECRLEWNG